MKLNLFRLIYNQQFEWGLGIGDWGLGPIPNPQSPIPQSPLKSFNFFNKIIKFFILLTNKIKNLLKKS